MKMNVIRAERTKVNGISKTGNPFNIDNTMVTVQVPIDSAVNPNVIGYQEMSYEFGDSHNFDMFKNINLPASLDVDLGAGFNQYGKVITVITDIKPPVQVAK